MPVTNKGRMRRTQIEVDNANFALEDALNARSIAIVTAHYRDGLKLYQIAQIMGISRTSVFQAEQRFLREMVPAADRL